MTKRLTPIVVQAPQRSEEWYRARLGNVTASQVTVTMAYSKPKPAQLAQATEVYHANDIDPGYVEELLLLSPIEFCLKVGVELEELKSRSDYRQELVTERITKMRQDDDKYVNNAMKWGIINEMAAVGIYHEITGNQIKDAPLMLHPTMLCGASPDGLVVDAETGELGNAEIKCLISRNHLYKVIMTDEMPPDYNDQVQMQMFINGRDWCDFIAYDSRTPLDLQVFIKRIPYDEFYVDNVMLPAIVRFLDECNHDERQFYAIQKSREARRLAKLEPLDRTPSGRPAPLSPVITAEEVAKFRHPDAQGDDSSI